MQRVSAICLMFLSISPPHVGCFVGCRAGRYVHESKGTSVTLTDNQPDSAVTTQYGGGFIGTISIGENDDTSNFVWSIRANTRIHTKFMKFDLEENFDLLNIYYCDEVTNI